MKGLNLFYKLTKSQLLGIKCVFKHKYLRMFDLQFNKDG